jgi:cell division protease FtsH
MEPKPTPKVQFSFLHFLLILMTFFMVRACFDNMKTGDIGFGEFKQQLSSGNITSVKILGSKIRGEFKKQINGKKEFETNVVDSEMANLLESHGVKYESLGDSNTFFNILGIILPIFFFLGFWFYIFRRGLKNMSGPGSFMSIGKNKAKIYVETDTKVTFKDVAGADEALEELKEVIDFLKNADKVKALGGKMPKGVLLVGAPGTGKTLIAKALAGEAGVPFFSTNGAEFVEMFVGVGAARVRDLFEQAKKSAPCIIFIDELDAMGKTRQISPLGGNDEKEQTLNQLLVEMDGFDTTGGIIILAATNRPELIDPALIRAGRFDRQVVVDKPDKKGREDILKIHSKTVKIDLGVNLEAVAGLTPGFSGADLANLVNEAALIATRKNANAVTLEHFTEALERMMAGLEKKNRLLNPKEKEIVAFHEMGHALVGHVFNADEKIHKVSIIPRGIGSMGYTIQRPTEDRYIMTKEELENKMTVLLAGRAAETLVFSHLSTGASDDLQKATNIARDMIMKFGMCQELGFVSYDETPHNFLDIRRGSSTGNYSDETAREIDENVKKIVWRSYHVAYNFLKQHRHQLDTSAKDLMEKETLNEDQLKTYFQSLNNPEEQTQTSVH